MSEVPGDQGALTRPGAVVRRPERERLAYLLVGSYAGISALVAIAGMPLIWLGVVALAVPLACRTPAAFRRACLWLAIIEMLILAVAGILPIYGSLIGLVFGAGVPFGLGALVLVLAAVCRAAPRQEAMLAFTLGISIVAVVLAQIFAAWLT
jgi:hypothetical protein